jgi:predicted ribosome quality control (RQC) complex YloA/Tae2 family protein
MKVILDFNKTVEENANEYYNKSRLSKKKLEGVNKTLSTFSEKKEKEEDIVVESKIKLKKLEDNKNFWFEKFKWFISSDNYLIVAGRDATTNEIVIKKHTISKDIVFHTDMAGSPFAVIKFDSSDIKLVKEDLRVPKFENIPQTTIKETASFVSLHAKGWKLGISDLKVFYVLPEQVSKEANPGEFIGKGSFMIRGKTNYTEYDSEYGIGIIGNKVVCAPLFAMQTHCKTVVQIIQGNEKASVVAKKIKSVFREREEVDISIDDIIKVLPAGGCDIKKERVRKY